MYQDHFNLSREPFSIAPDPEFLFLSESHNEALSHLLYGLSHGGFVLISGEVGTGKTTILRNLLKSIPSQMDVAFILNPRLTVIELLETVCEEFGLDPSMHNSQTVKGYVDLLSSFLRDNNTRDRSAVLIIDEAQNLSAHEIKTIITRVGENTKIVFTGDIDQIDNVYVDATSNGLSYVVEKMKDQYVAGHITLKKGERSILASIASKIL